MRKSGAASEKRSVGVAAVAVAFAVFILAYGSNVAASEHGRWPGATYYTVLTRPGDTLIAIGHRYRVSPPAVAKVNGLDAPSHINSGRVIIIPAHSRETREAVLSEALDHLAPGYATSRFARVEGYPLERSRRPVAATTAVNSGVLSASKPTRLQRGGLPFSWPITGPVISAFGPGAQGTRNDGINIAADLGAPFRAAADGTVSYAGPLRGYGNLILIMHAGGYVTAYAHAENIAVSPGEEVGKGQVIGTAGETGGVNRPQLHFEIRRGVKAIDPNRLLAANG